MESQFLRTEMLLGKENMEKLARSHVAVFGLGGVGGYAAEALARSGIGFLDLIDHDQVTITNLNRQLIALHSTLGRDKVTVMKERILDINPEAQVNAYPCFYLPETGDRFDFSQYSYVVDCVDTVTAKLLLIEKAKEAGVPIISSMGTAKRTDPSKLAVSDIYESYGDGLSRVMRREARKRGITSLKVVWSKEPPVRKDVLGSTPFVPPAAGLLLASEVVRDLCRQEAGL